MALMMEAVRTCETSVHSDETTRRYIPEDPHIHTLRREKLNSQCYSRNVYEQNDYRHDGPLSGSLPQIEFLKKSRYVTLALFSNNLYVLKA
jgi:hypothetical protein